MKSKGDKISETKREDLRGQKFGRLIVISVIRKNRPYCICQCDCGKIVEVASNNLKAQKTKSCGCLRSEKLKTKRGELHHSWKLSLSNEERVLNLHRNYNPQVYEFKQKILKKFNYKCSLTGENSKLELHHLLNWSEYPDLRFDENNVIIVTKRFHRLFHSLYGQTRNDRKQWDEFENSYLLLGEKLLSSHSKKNTQKK